MALNKVGINLRLKVPGLSLGLKLCVLDPGLLPVFTRDSIYAIARICHANSVRPSVRPSKFETNLLVGDIM